MWFTQEGGIGGGKCREDAGGAHATNDHRRTSREPGVPIRTDGQLNYPQRRPREGRDGTVNVDAADTPERSVVEPEIVACPGGDRTKPWTCQCVVVFHHRRDVSARRDPANGALLRVPDVPIRSGHDRNRMLPGESNSCIVPAVLIRPTPNRVGPVIQSNRVGSVQLNHRWPSGPTVKSSGRTSFVVAKEVTSPFAVIRPTAVSVVNQTLPKGPLTMARAGWGIANRLMVPSLITRPIAESCLSVNHRSLLAPTASRPGHFSVGSSMTLPLRSRRAARLTRTRPASPTIQRFLSGPHTRPLCGTWPPGRGTNDSLPSGPMRPSRL